MQQRKSGPARLKRRLTLEPLETRQLLAGLPEFVTALPEVPRNLYGPLVTLGSSAYFGLVSPTAGGELFKADDDNREITLVKDIVPGVMHGFPQQVTVVNGKLVFSASNHYVHDREDQLNNLWVSDGTEQGTHKIFPDGSPDAPRNWKSMVSVGDRALFTNERDSEVWITDGTATGTLKLSSESDLRTPLLEFGVAELGSNIFFVTENALWKTDGTPENTQQVATFARTPSQLVNVAGTLYFIAYDADHGVELWSSDGTTVGTAIFKDIVPGATGSSPRNLVNHQGRLVFSADDGFHGPELWVSNGTESGTTLLFDVRSGSSGSAPASLVSVGNILYFVADGDESGKELWRYDDSQANAIRLTDLAAAGPTGLVAAGEQLFFKDPAANVWRSAGELADTTIVTDTAGNLFPGGADPLAVMGNRVLVIGVEGILETDGSAAGTKLFVACPTYSVDPQHFTEMGGDLYFGSYGFDSSGVYTGHFLKSDGTAQGTILIDDSLPDIPENLVDHQDALFFTTDRTYTQEAALWKSNGTKAGTQRIFAFPGGTPQATASIGGILFLSLQTSSGSYQLWASDGTTAGTSLVKSFGMQGPNQAFGTFVDLSNKLYFTFQDSAVQLSLWVSDGTSDGTQIVKTLATQQSIANLSVFHDLLYIGLTATGSTQLLTSDGTADGTQLLKSFATDYGFGNFAPAENYLYFSQDGIWRTDGTAQGTELIQGYLPPIASFSGEGNTFLALGDTLFFSQWDAEHGEELWRTDGTPQGAYLLQDVANPGGFDPRDLVQFHDQLYFSGGDNIRGRGLWRVSLSDDPLVTVPATASYAENASPTLVAPGATVSDADSTDFDTGSLIVTIAEGASADDRLTIVSQGDVTIVGDQVLVKSVLVGTISGGSGGQSLVVALNSNATFSSTQQVLRSIGFWNAGDSPAPSPRLIEFVLRDGDGGWSHAASSSTLVHVTAVNDAPALNNSLSPQLATIYEEAVNPPGTRVSVLLAGAVTDPDAGALAGIAVSYAPETSGKWYYLLPGGDWQAMQQPSDAAALLLPSDARVRFIPKPNFAGSVKLGYWAWDQTKGNPGETLPLVGNRGGTKSLSNAYEAATLKVTAVNDAGSVSISGTVKEDRTLTANASDPDGVPASIGYQWHRNTGAGFVAISGATSRTYLLGDADVGATLRVRAFYTDKQGFSESRTSAATSRVINVNDAPKLELGGTIGYVSDDPAFVLAAGARVTDVDNADFNRGRLRVRIGDGAGSANLLEIGAGFSVDNQNVVRFGNTIIGQRTASGIGTNELIVFFNSDATPEIVQTLVRSITFKTVGGAAGTRKVIFTVSDGKGGVSLEATKTVAVS